MDKKIPIGIDNFKELRKEEYYYVDKTEAINEILNKGNKVSLFTRPRRFGKTLFISMLDQFFNIEYNSKELFKDLSIEHSKYYTEMNQYPVIVMDFKGIKARTFQEFFIQFKMECSRIIKQFTFLENSLQDIDLKKYKLYKEEKGQIDDYKRFLQNICEWLYNYYKKPVIILIDEYDTPIQASYVNKYYDECMNLIRLLLLNSLKGNKYLKLGILTGILRIGKESLFSDLNNLVIYDLLSEQYNEYFGFTEDETKELLEYYNLELNKKVKDMYDGFNFGEVHIYNPWSILNYASTKKLDDYWSNTSSNESLLVILEKSDENTKTKLDNLIIGIPVLFEYNEHLSYRDIMDSKKLDINTAFSFLLTSGYITVKNRISQYRYMGALPNGEALSTLSRLIGTYITSHNLVDTDEIYKLKESFETENKESIEEIFNERIAFISYFDEKENFYHGFTFGLLQYVFSSDEYYIESNRESGKGRFDLAIVKKDMSNVIILELKTKNYIAKKQIDEKEYVNDFINKGYKNIITYGIIFDGKSVAVE